MKKIYVTPEVCIKPCNMESLLTTVSPGQKGDYDENFDIESKQAYFDNELDFGSDFGE